jgi:hypothetical protein
MVVRRHRDKYDVIIEAPEAFGPDCKCGKDSTKRAIKKKDVTKAERVILVVMTFFEWAAVSRS